MEIKIEKSFTPLVVFMVRKRAANIKYSYKSKLAYERWY